MVAQTNASGVICQTVKSPVLVLEPPVPALVLSRTCKWAPAVEMEKMGFQAVSKIKKKSLHKQLCVGSLGSR